MKGRSNQGMRVTQSCKARGKLKMTTHTADVLKDFDLSHEDLIQVNFSKNIVCHLGILNWKTLIL